MWKIALNLGHWDKRSWTKLLPVRLLSLKFCQLEGKKKGLRSFSQKDFLDQGEEGVHLERILKEDQTGASLDMPALPGITC